MAEPCKRCGGEGHTDVDRCPRIPETICHRCRGGGVEPKIKAEWQDVVRGDPMLEEMAKRFFPDLFGQETVH